MITIGPIRHAGNVVIYNPDNPLQVRQFTGDGSPRWVDAADAGTVFSECIVALVQSGTTGTYNVTVDLPSDRVYSFHVYDLTATAFDDVVITQGLWTPERSFLAADQSGVQILGGLDVSGDTIAASGDWISSGNLGAQVWSYGNRTLTDSFRSSVPSLQFGSRQLVAGDDYGVDARAFLVKAADGGEFPVDLDDYDWTITVTKAVSNPHESAPATINGTATVITPTGSSRALSIAIDGADTNNALGEYLYSVKGTHSITGDVWTVEKGSIIFVAA